MNPLLYDDLVLMLDLRKYPIEDSVEFFFESFLRPYNSTSRIIYDLRQHLKNTTELIGRRVSVALGAEHPLHGVADSARSICLSDQ